MSISRITRQRLFEDEKLFNGLLAYARYDAEMEMFIHTDASLWTLFELNPKWITKVSDAEAFQLSERMQELLDAMEHTVSAQFSWITTFDVEDTLRDCLARYPLGGPAGWMTKRWVRMIRLSSTSDSLHRRPRRLRLIVGFRFDPPWTGKGFVQQLMRSVKLLLGGQIGFSANQRHTEYMGFANKFRGLMDGAAAKLSDLGFYPRRMDGQDLVNVLYPLLNRRTVKSGKYRRGRTTATPVPVYDPDDLLANQVSETPVEHPRDGMILKDGRAYRSVSMVKPPKQCLPLMIAPLQSAPYENILSVTFSKDPKEKQLKRLDTLDSTLGMRERSSSGVVQLQGADRSSWCAPTFLYNQRG
jgi:TraC protein